MASGNTSTTDNLDRFFTKAHELFEPPEPLFRFRYIENDHKLIQQSVDEGCSEHTGVGRRSRRTLSQIASNKMFIDRFIQLPFANESAGTIVCEDTLPYVESAEIALAEMKRVLADDGFLFLRIQADLSDDQPWLWRPTPQGLARRIDVFDASIIGWSASREAPLKPKVLYAVAAGCRSAEFLGQRAGRFIKYMQETAKPGEVIDFLVDAPAECMDWIFE